MSKNIKTIPLQDYLDVVAVVENYIEGLRVGDAKQVAKSFHPDATMYGFALDGSPLFGHISNLWIFMEQNGSAPKIRARNDIISITPTTAVVKVDMECDAAGNDYTDNHTLLKQDGKWRIIAKVFHTYAK
ncbi:hypothetical protein BKA61DRAFT_663317 [Leptodontidium sp. MPI-SDFR-AT-0119]|nr:hypothetical protein BKA61DRAFT_663317 [Leptodontidium sp. MPI-SDFR-AT-0119]